MLYDIVKIYHRLRRCWYTGLWGKCVFFLAMISGFVLPVCAKSHVKHHTKGLKLLKEVCQVYQKCPGLKMQFTYCIKQNSSAITDMPQAIPNTATNATTSIPCEDEQVDTFKGTILFKGKQYHLILPDQQTWYDGQTVWQYLPYEKEVTIYTVQAQDHILSQIYALYQHGYVVVNEQFDIKAQPNTAMVTLAAEDATDMMVNIQLAIDLTTKHIKHWCMEDQQGIQYHYVVQHLDTKLTLSKDAFQFPQQAYPDIEVNDLRHNVLPDTKVSAQSTKKITSK